MASHGKWIHRGLIAVPLIFAAGSLSAQPQPVSIIGSCKNIPACSDAATIAAICQSLANISKAIANCSPPSSVGSCPRGTVQVLQSNANRYIQELDGLLPRCVSGPPRQPQCTAVSATTLTPLQVFSGGSDGGAPFAGLVFDKGGSLYGTTVWGGAGRGLVFKLTPPAATQTKWNETVLYDFSGGNDGSGPFSTLILDNTGAVYGTTATGGSGSTQGSRVFELKSSPTVPWSELVLASLSDEGGNNYISSGVIIASGGGLFGVTTGTTWGGSGTDNGTVFQITPDPSTLQWKQTTLYTFAGGSDGFNPYYALTADSSGALYGTTQKGGAGFGTVFKLTPPELGKTQWTETVLYRFSGDIGFAAGSLIFDKSGALYGNAAIGPSGLGGVFKLTPPGSGQTQWSETVLFKFSGGNEGGSPGGSLIFDKSGALYGATWQGGGTGNGTVFRLTPPGPGKTLWNETVLYNFSGGIDGANPNGSLVADQCGALYGTANGGGAGSGTVFQLTFPP